MIHSPAPSPSPLLSVSVQPRHSIYDSSESKGDFVVDAIVSYSHGRPFKNATSTSWRNEIALLDVLDFEIRVDVTDELLVSNIVSINSTDNVFRFDLTSLEPRLEPYNIVLYSALVHKIGGRKHAAFTELYYLPAKYSGSTVKLDNLYGGMLVANNITNYSFEPFFPFGFYTSCSGYLNYSLANASQYKDMGFNAINPVCAFTDGDLRYLFDWMDEINLWYQYDMRGSYLNLTSVEEQIPLIKDRSAFLSWYTADEPDGWQYALNSTKVAYDLLKEQDPYHPTGLVLNCDNYHFKEYMSGADYLMEDAYPIGINSTYSKVWNSTCNETYGDCGCDNCVGELQDVSNRLDSYLDYQKWIGEPEKPLWSVLQAFSDGGYWGRDPTDDETWGMILLSLNHRAKAVMSWTFPTSKLLAYAHGAFSKVATAPPVSNFLLGAEPTQIKFEGRPLLDVSYWKAGGQIMVGVANLVYDPTHQTAFLEIPESVDRIVEQPWGSLRWTLSCISNTSTMMSVHGLRGLATNIVILDM